MDSMRSRLLGSWGGSQSLTACTAPASLCSRVFISVGSVCLLIQPKTTMARGCRAGFSAKANLSDRKQIFEVKPCVYLHVLVDKQWLRTCLTSIFYYREIDFSELMCFLYLRGLDFLDWGDFSDLKRLFHTQYKPLPTQVPIYTPLGEEKQL